MLVRRLTILALLGILPCSVPATAQARSARLKFTVPLQLKKYSGGEPSIAFDPRGNGHVYVTAPQSIPSAANGTPLGNPDAGSNGVGFWGSADGGRSFPLLSNIAATNGGGDSDVEVGNDGTVYVADLEAVSADICQSNNGGRSFHSGGLLNTSCSGINDNQAGGEEDREWLSHGPKGELYLTHHDFAFGYPEIFKSTDHGRFFLPCGIVLDPTGPAGRVYTPSGGTLLSKPIVGPDGTIYIVFSTPSLISSPLGAPISEIFIAVAKGGCSPTKIFKNYRVYSDPGATLGNLFDSFGMDGGGNLYVTASGKVKSSDTDTGLYLWRSTDHGVHWSAPRKVSRPSMKANMLPSVAGGLIRNSLALGWYATGTSTDANGLKDQWRFYAATSFDGGRSFHYANVSRTVFHHGDICNQGTFCGLIPGKPGNRNLADFSSVAVDPRNGCVALALPGDPENRPDLANGKNSNDSHAYVARQSGGRCLARVRHRRTSRRHR